MALASNMEIIGLVQAGDLAGATAAINAIMDKKSKDIVSEAKAFVAASLFVPATPTPEA